MMEAGKEGRCSDSPLASLVTKLPLSDLLLTGVKPLGFSLQEIVAASHEQLQAAAEAPGLSGPVTPQPHLLVQPCRRSNREEGALQLGEHCHRSNNSSLPLLLPTLFCSHSPHPHTPISPKMQTLRKAKGEAPAYSLHCLSFLIA